MDETNPQDRAQAAKEHLKGAADDLHSATKATAAQFQHVVEDAWAAIWYCVDIRPTWLFAANSRRVNELTQDRTEACRRLNPPNTVSGEAFWPLK